MVSVSGGNRWGGRVLVALSRSACVALCASSCHVSDWFITTLIVSLFITLRGLGRLLNDVWVIGLLRF